MSALSTPSLRLATAFGTGAAAWLSGYIASMSIAGMPAISQSSPSSAPRSWRRLYDIGVRTAPAIALTSSLAFSYAAWTLSRSVAYKAGVAGAVGEVYKLAAAAVTVVLIAPWTRGMMLGVNGALDKKLALAKRGEAKGREEGDEELIALLSQWAGLNGVRSCFPAVAALVGLWVLVG